MAQPQAQRAGLVLPPPRIRQLLKDIHPGRLIGKNAPVVIAAATQSIMTEIMALLIARVKSDRRQRIMDKDIVQAIRRDEELAQLFASLVFAEDDDGGPLFAVPYPDGPSDTDLGKLALVPRPRAAIGDEQ